MAESIVDSLFAVEEVLDRVLPDIRRAVFEKRSITRALEGLIRTLQEVARPFVRDDGMGLEDELRAVFLHNSTKEQVLQMINAPGGIRQTLSGLIERKRKKKIGRESLEQILPIATGLQRDLRRIKRLFWTAGRNPLEMDILGYGEISTVMKPRGRFHKLPVSTLCISPWVYKRMPIFPSKESARKYIRVYEEYRRILNHEIGLHVPPQSVQFVEREDGRVSLYALQRQLPSENVCHKLIHRVDSDTGAAIFLRILNEYRKVWEFNSKNGPIQVGLDGQISNWALLGDLQQLTPKKVAQLPISYLDTGTPLFRINGVEQLETEIFLKNSPSFLRWIIRQFFLQDVLDRYYDLRSVVLDAIANLYKEGRPEWIPRWVDLANAWFRDSRYVSIEPLTEKEIRRYYREDAFIWRLFQTSRRIDRFITEKIRRQRYEFRLPGKIKR